MIKLDDKLDLLVLHATLWFVEDLLETAICPFRHMQSRALVFRQCLDAASYLPTHIAPLIELIDGEKSQVKHTLMRC